VGLGTALSGALGDVEHAAGDVGTFVKRGLGDAIGGVEKVPYLGSFVHDTGRVLTNVAQWDRDSYTWGISRPLSTVMTVGVNMNNWGDAFKGSTWAKSWNESSYVSPGQAFMANMEISGAGFHGQAAGLQEQQNLQHTFEDPNLVHDAFHNGSTLARLVSGTYDAGTSWYGDPLNIVGGGAAKFRQASHMTSGIESSEQAARQLARPGVQKMLNATDKMAAYQARKMPWIAKASNPDLLAGVFNQTVARPIREAAYRFMISDGNDAKAASDLANFASSNEAKWGSLADQAASVREALANSRQPFNTDVQLAQAQSTSWSSRILSQVGKKSVAKDLTGVSSAAGNSAYDQILHSALDDAEKKLNLTGNRGRLLDDIQQMKGHISWQPGLFDVPLSAYKAAFTSLDKFGDASKIAEHIPGGNSVPGKFVVQTLYKGLYNTPVKVLRAFGDMWPRGWIDFTSTRAGDDLESFLNSAKGVTPEARQGYLNRFYQASSVDDKRVVVADAEQHAATSILKARGATDAEAADILDGHNQLRSGVQKFITSRVQRGASSAFSAATDASGNRVDQLVTHLMDEDGTPIAAPILETMRRQGTPMMDLGALDTWAKDNLSRFRTVRKGLRVGENALVHSADLFNSMWKNGVLLRLGFTPRVMTDMGLRSLVVLGGMRTLGVTGEAAGNVLHNVGVTGKTIANGILKNRLFDPDTITDLNDKVGGAATARDALRADYVSTALQEAADKQAVRAGLKPLLDPNIAGQVQTKLESYQAAQAAYDDLRKSANKFQKTRFGDGALTYKGVRLTDIFGGENATWLASQVSSHRMIGAMFQKNADMANGLTGSGQWDTVRAHSQNELEAASHLPSWRHAINNQIMGSTLGAKIVREKMTEADVLKYLGTAEGKAWLKGMGDFRTPEEAAHAAAVHVHYTVPEPVANYLRTSGAKALSVKKLDQLVPNVFDRPDVNGQLLNISLQPNNGITRMMQHWQAATHKWLGEMPLDTFVYHPTAAAFYRGHLAESIDKYVSFNGLQDAKSLAMNPALVQRIEKEAFAQAKNDVWQIQYDLSKQSVAAHQLRFVFPFMNAQQEIIKHWFNIALDHPWIVQREQQIWNSPGKAGMLYDSQTGELAGPNTAPENQVVRFQIPHWVSNIPGLGSFQDMGQMQISNQSLNPILQGQHWYVPGAGPMVQASVQALAKFNPQVVDNGVLKQILPYGPGDNITSAILPAWANRLETGMNVSDPQYSTTFAKVYQAETIRYNEGLRTSAPTMQEILSRTKQLLILQAISSAVLPASVKYNAGTQVGGPQKPRADVTSGLETKSVPDLSRVPIQALVDQYKKLETADPANAQTDFYNQYGQALFAITMATAKSNASVPSTAAGLAAISNPEIKALIAEDPSIAYAIVGPQASQGPFDMNAYMAELNTQIGNGNTNTYRAKLSPVDMVKEAKAQLGWQQYDQLMSIIDAKMGERGITSLNQTGAKDLKTIKDQFVANMNTVGSQDYNPDWFTQYSGSSTDWTARIQSLTDLVSDPNLVNNPGRTDLKVLGQYLEGRQELNQILASRANKEGLPSSITTKSNADLQQAWDGFVSQLVMSNTNFAMVYQHLLAGDPVDHGLKSNQGFQQSLSGMVGA
jgi:hypothetical protein